MTSSSSSPLVIDFSLTVKAATLIFISGRGSAISSANASVRFALRRVYVAPTMSKSPCGIRRRPCDHRTDLRASWPLRFCLTPHNDKFEARRHIAVTSHDPCTGTVRWSWGQRTILDCHFWPKNDRRLLR